MEPVVRYGVKQDWRVFLETLVDTSQTCTQSVSVRRQVGALRLPSTGASDPAATSREAREPTSLFKVSGLFCTDLAAEPTGS